MILMNRESFMEQFAQLHICFLFITHLLLDGGSGP